MNYIPRPFVQPSPSSKAFGRKLARLLATARKRESKRANGPACAAQAETWRFNQ